MFEAIKQNYDATSLPYRIAVMVESAICEDDEVIDCLADLNAAHTLGALNRVPAALQELETAFDLWLLTTGQAN